MSYLWAMAHIEPIQANSLGLEKTLLCVIWPLGAKIIREDIADKFFYIAFWEEPSVEISFPVSNNIKVQRALNDRVNTMLTSFKAKRQIKHFFYTVQDMVKYVNAHGGPLGYRYSLTYYYQTSLVALRYLRHQGSFQGSTHRALFALAMADAILETVSSNLDMKILILKKGIEIYKRILRKDKYHLKQETLKSFYIQNFHYFLSVVNPKKPHNISPKLIGESANQAFIRQMKKCLLPLGRDLMKSKRKMERFWPFEDIVWRRLIHPGFNRLGYSAAEELLLTYSLYNLYGEINKW